MEVLQQSYSTLIIIGQSDSCSVDFSKFLLDNY